MYLKTLQRKSRLTSFLLAATIAGAGFANASQQDAVDQMSKGGITTFLHFNENSDLPVFIPWNERIQNFPVEPLADMLEAGGVKLLFFTITHHDYNLPFPVPSTASANMKNLYAGRSADRDLMNDIYEALNARGIKLGFYFNPLPDTEEQAFQDQIGFPDGDWLQNMYETVEMTSDHYGDKVSAWWIDNMAKSSHSRKIDPSEFAGYLRSGNADALIAYNVGGQNGNRQIPFANDGDVSHITNFTAGHLKNKDLNYLKPASKFDSNGLLNYRLDQMQRGWAVQEPDSEVGGSWQNARYKMPVLLEYMYGLRSVGAVSSWNVAPYLDGDIDERVVNQWVMIGQAMKHGKAFVSEDDDMITYAGFSTTQEDLFASDRYLAESSQNGDTATITYTGSRIELWGKKQSIGGDCSISIDGSTVETLSQNSSSDENQVKFFDSGPLQSGEHTLVMKNVGGGTCTLDHVFYTPELANKADGADFEYGSGWSSQTSNESYDNTIHYTDVDTRSADFEFTGDRFQIFSQIGPGGGVFDVWINGEVVATVDTYSPTKQHQVLVYSSPILVPGFQDVRVRTKSSSEANPAASNSWVHVDYIQYNETVPEGYIIDSIHHDINYDSNWGFHEKDEAHLNVVSYSKVSNTQASYTFNGTGVKIISRKNTGGGICQIKIDGNLIDTVDLYSSTWVDKAEVFSKQDLSSGSHTIEFVVDGTKNSNSTNYYCVIDRFEISPYPINIIAAPVLGDWDEDGDVDNNDIRALTIAIQKRQVIDSSFDLNNDGVVNILDARVLMSMCTRDRCAI
ncbi:alpha-L-fucosidase [uncultured Paraglaciecola sp.]|uniref:alpha-L-fucosidase n=1 Tax=uncultured Paraglaciecola sp. TaxID=1765024 RepID=UPI0030DA64F5|tara:strand:+ start:32061 stop:34439 length:2379 start_codon:yes stop_codon:yes gene_type:complete